MKANNARLSRSLRTLASVALAGALVASGVASAAQSPQIPLAAKNIPQFVQPLPLLSVQPGGTMKTVFGNTGLTLRMCEFKANVLPAAAVPGYAGTWVWGYLVDPTGASTCAQLIGTYGNAAGVIDTYIGPVIVSRRGGGSTDITWVNDLGSAATTNVLAYKFSTDQTLHWADPLSPQTDNVVNDCMMKGAMGTFVGPNGVLQNFPAPGDPCAQNYAGPVAAAPHMHGGEQPAEIDGSPDSWWTSDGQHFGHKYYTFGLAAGASPAPGTNFARYNYPNTQEAAPIWFHDHTLGATRLNVYAGLAGAYYIDDPALHSAAAGGTCTANCLPDNLQPVASVVPLVLQDRMFDTNGQLFFTADDAGNILWALNPQHPYWNPEFVGDTIVINGKAWPFFNVEPKRYRFLFLNGSNARTYEMFLVDPITKVMGPPMWVIATDGGYLDAPAKIDPNAATAGAQTKLLIQPGERYEVIIDFGAVPAGTNLVLKNTGRTPFPKGTSPQGTTLGQMMQFKVGACASLCGAQDPSYDPASGTPLRTGGNAIQRLVAAGTATLAPGVTVQKTRQVTLNEIALLAQTAIDPVTGILTPYPGGPFEILVNNTKWAGKEPMASPRPDFTSVTVKGNTTGFSELPQEGNTEIWKIVNLTADAHPIHLHLIQFQVLSRQAFNVGNYTKAYNAAFGTNPNVPLLTGCTAGLFCPAYGPPLDYNTGNPLALGGNPDITPFLQGLAQPALPSERGWKDTAINYPGMVTTYAVRWAPNALPVNTPPAQLAFPFDPSGDNFNFNYVWHCHIIDHEDNEMMRPDLVTLNPSAPAPVSRVLVKGAAY